MELKRRKDKVNTMIISVCSCILLVLGFWNIFLYVQGRGETVETVFTKTITSDEFESIQIDPEVLRKEELSEALSRYGKTDIQEDLLDSEAETLTAQMQSLVNLMEEIAIAHPTDTSLDSMAITEFKTLETFDKLLKYPALYTSWENEKQLIGDAYRTPHQSAVQNARFIEIDPTTINDIVDAVPLADTLVQGEDLYEIRGDQEVDAYIRTLATKRGYKLRPIASASTLKNFDDYLIHPILIRDWNKLLIESNTDGLELVIVSGFRSPETQTTIFNSSLDNKLLQTGGEVTNEQILAGEVDEEIDAVLSLSSIPGYSKHHTGYTIDINDLSTNQGFTQFKNTDGYAWLVKDNYLRLKVFGFVPSYPVGGSNFGPNPEEWEYSWVGTQALERDFSLGLT